MRIRLLTMSSLLMLASCGKGGNDPAPTCPNEAINPLLIEVDQDADGFVETDKCDSLLFTAMLSTAGFSVNITAAEASSGKWYRRPVTYEECWSVGESRSTISRDMLLGVYWHAWLNRDVQMLYRIWNYGVSNAWIMGDGRASGADAIMNTAMISTLAQMIWKLDGNSLETSYLGNLISRNLPVTWGVSDDQEYVNRLTAMHIYLRKQIYGGVGDNAQEVTQELVDRYPTNPLFLLANGNYCEALDYANDHDHLPGGIHSDHEYKYERIFVLGRLRDL